MFLIVKLQLKEKEQSLFLSVTLLLLSSPYVLVLSWWAGCPLPPYLSDSGGTSQTHGDMHLKIISPSVPCNDRWVCEPECTYMTSGIQPGLSIMPLDEADIATRNIISLNNPHPGFLQLCVCVREYHGLCLLKRACFLTNKGWLIFSYFVCVFVSQEHAVTLPCTWVMACAYAPSGCAVACGWVRGFKKVLHFVTIGSIMFVRQHLYYNYRHILLQHTGLILHFLHNLNEPH